jgi:hypothetical protein
MATHPISSHAAQCPCQGTLRRIDHTDGDMITRSPNRERKVTAVGDDDGGIDRSGEYIGEKVEATFTSVPFSSR